VRHDGLDVRLGLGVKQVVAVDCLGIAGVALSRILCSPHFLSFSGRVRS
jgi:hypothetical protein